MRSELAIRLKEVRERAGISQRELGDLAGVSETYPALIESGRRQDPGAEILGRLAGVLGCTTDYLILGVGSPPSDDEMRTAIAVAGARRDAREAAAPEAAS